MQVFGSVSLLRFVALVMLISACQPQPAKELNETDSSETTALPRLPVIEAPSDRRALLRAAADAASAAALGKDDRDAQLQLDGDRFEFRMRFGCSSRSEIVSSGAFQVDYDDESRRLRVRAAPDLIGAEPWVAALGDDNTEAVEGFWVRTPWMLTSGCPGAGRPPAAEETKLNGSSQPNGEPFPDRQPGGSVGIAQFFSEAESRVTRRDQRAYELTKTLPEGQGVPPQGYDFILSGRLQKLPGGRVIACHVVSPSLPPDCLVSVKFDEARIERADTQETLAEWGF